jgi:hypothetical protein
MLKPIKNQARKYYIDKSNDQIAERQRRIDIAAVCDRRTCKGNACVFRGVHVHICEWFVECVPAGQTTVFSHVLYFRQKHGSNVQNVPENLPKRPCDALKQCAHSWPFQYVLFFPPSIFLRCLFMWLSVVVLCLG